jgi:ABC-type dipeptide/oligopeptide/nickel transport system permease component
MIGRYLVRRLVQAIPTLLGITVLAYALMRLAPGDPLLVFEDSRGVTAEQMAALRQAYGFDRPLPIQYLDWLGRAARLDFGRSFQTHLPARDLILERVPATLELTLAALVVGLGFGIPAGLWAAVHRGRWPDQLIRVFAVVGDAVPHFWLGLIALAILAVQLRWLPTGGILTLGANPLDLGDRLRHLLLPAVVLGTSSLAIFARYMRTEVLEVLGQDYVRTARAKGLSEWAVVRRHALKNALIPVVTVVGLQFGTLIGGAVITEYIFALPGVGRLVVDAVFARDYPLVQGVVLLITVGFIASNLVVDILYGWLDPRIRYA